jgi:hypothetical protein
MAKGRIPGLIAEGAALLCRAIGWERGATPITRAIARALLLRSENAQAGPRSVR